MIDLGASTQIVDCSGIDKTSVKRIVSHAKREKKKECGTRKVSQVFLVEQGSNGRVLHRDDRQYRRAVMILLVMSFC